MSLDMGPLISHGLKCGETCPHVDANGLSVGSHLQKCRQKWTVLTFIAVVIAVFFFKDVSFCTFKFWQGGTYWDIGALMTWIWYCKGSIVFIIVKFLRMAIITVNIFL